MTVRANKPAFNVREKLKELERPIGVKGNELMRAETAQEAGALLGVGRKNAIINGDFRIAQRSTDTGTITLSTLNEYKTVDRQSAYSYNYSGTFTPQYRIRQYADHPISGAQGYCLRYDCISADTPATNIDFLTTYQAIEANNAINFYNNYLSLSFWVKSNKTGPYTVQFRANGSVSATTPNSMWKYYVNNPDVWEYKTILISPQNLSLITAGNGQGYNLFFHLASGQNKNHSSNIGDIENKWGFYSSNGVAFTDQTNLMSNAGNYWQVTNIQLEIGKVATEFEHRSYGEELALCQRYYEVFVDYQAAAHRGLDNNYDGHVVITGPTYAVPKRANPTVTLSDTYGWIANNSSWTSGGSVQRRSTQGVSQIVLEGVWNWNASSQSTIAIKVTLRSDAEL